MSAEHVIVYHLNNTNGITFDMYCNFILRIPFWNKEQHYMLTLSQSKPFNIKTVCITCLGSISKVNILSFCTSSKSGYIACFLSALLKHHVAIDNE